MDFLHSVLAVFVQHPFYVLLFALFASFGVILIASYLSRDDTPYLRVKRYSTDHEGYSLPVPGDSDSFTTTEKGTFETADGLILRTYTLAPRKRKHPIGVVVFFPDLCSHVGRSRFAFELYADAGFLVHGLDYPGFGESEGQRGVIENWKDLYHTCLLYVQSIHSKHSRFHVPIYTVGEGMGGSLALLLALTEPSLVSAASVFSPALKPGSESIFSMRQTILNLFAWLYPSFKYARLFNDDMLSRNLAVEESLQADRLFFKEKLTAQTLVQIRTMCQFLLHRVHLLYRPFQIQHGAKDLLWDYNGSRAMYTQCEHVPPPVKTVVWYHLGWHSLLSESEAPEVVHLSIDFLEKQVLHSQLLRTLD